MKCNVCLLVLSSLVLLVSAEEAQRTYCDLDDTHLAALTECVTGKMSPDLSAKLDGVRTNVNCEDAACTLRRLCAQGPLSSVSVFTDDEKAEFRRHAAECSTHHHE
ncbi:unnamed protein product [Ixodes hexagonus]